MTTVSIRAPYLPGLDSLRGFASLAVVITHCAFWAGFYDAGLLGAFAQRLEVGVAIFFVLSGYLLSYPWLAAARTGTPSPAVGTYLRKRALRVLPVYWVTVVLAMTLIETNRNADQSVWLHNLAMIQYYFEAPFPEGLIQMWSLSTEVAFYLVLPGLLLLLVRAAPSRPRAQLRVLAALGILSIIWSGVAAGPFAGWGSWATLALPGFICWFAAGIAVAIVHVESRLGDSRWAPIGWCRSAAAAPASCWMIAVALLVVQSTPLGGAPGLLARTPSESVLRALLYLAAAVAVLIPPVFGDPDARFARGMAWRPLRHLGAISYSLFCCHVIVLAVLFEYTSWEIFQENVFVVFAGTLAVSLLVAEVLYRLVERPFLKLKIPRREQINTPPKANQPIS